MSPRRGLMPCPGSSRRSIVPNAIKELEERQIIVRVDRIYRLAGEVHS
jgi:hypothetical protein